MSNKRKDIALLVARLIIGGIFITTGWMKISNFPATIGFFSSLGIPAFLAYVVGYLEFIGGITLVLGVWTCLSAAVLAVIMVFAVWFTHSMGFQAFGTPLATLAGLVSLVGSCGGKYALACKCESKESSS